MRGEGGGVGAVFGSTCVSLMCLMCLCLCGRRPVCVQIAGVVQDHRLCVPATNPLQGVGRCDGCYLEPPKPPTSDV